VDFSFVTYLYLLIGQLEPRLSGVGSRRLVDWFLDESAWLGCPDLSDVCVGHETAEGLGPVREVVGGHEIRQVGAQLGLLR